MSYIIYSYNALVAYALQQSWNGSIPVSFCATLHQKLAALPSTGRKVNLTISMIMWKGYIAPKIGPMSCDGCRHIFYYATLHNQHYNSRITSPTTLINGGVQDVDRNEPR